MAGWAHKPINTVIYFDGLLFPETIIFDRSDFMSVQMREKTSWDAPSRSEDNIFWINKPIQMYLAGYLQEARRFFTGSFQSDMPRRHRFKVTQASALGNGRGASNAFIDWIVGAGTVEVWRRVSHD